jgi:5-(carboxyamino)imidazole ribonucleotide synthase
MTHQAAIALGQSLRVLAASPDDGAALVAADTVIGHHTDLDALRGFAKGCDVVTFDHEHVPSDHIRALVAEGVVVRPGPDALLYTQDKAAMRARLTELEVPVPAWRRVTTMGDIADFSAALGQGGAPARANGGLGTGTPSGASGKGAGGTEASGPGAGGRHLVAKAVTGGYDGRGVWDVSHPDEIEALLRGGTELIVEERVRLRRELAAMVARSPWGQVAAYPVVETVQQDGICVEVLAPAPGLRPDAAVRAQELAIRLAAELDVVGLLAVELFESLDGELLVNELAMRPHNSGHWTIEGARTSQFEQHLRAVLDYPLGETSLTAPAVALANVLGGQPGGMGIDERLHHLFASDPGARVHLYGKQVRPGRKIGHVTILGGQMESVRARAVRAARWLREGTGGD